jgi:hypothetical protein
MTWAHWLVILLFLIGLALAESLRNQEQAATNKEETNEHRNTYRSGYIPSRHQSPAHQNYQPKATVGSKKPQTSHTNPAAHHRRHTTEKN